MVSIPLTVQTVENWFRLFKSGDFDHPWMAYGGTRRV